MDRIVTISIELAGFHSITTYYLYSLPQDVYENKNKLIDEVMEIVKANGYGYTREDLEAEVTYTYDIEFGIVYKD